MARKPLLSDGLETSELARYGFASAAMKSRPSRFRTVWTRDKHLYVLFLLPFLYFMVFHYAPMYGVLLAFKDYSVGKGILGSDWVGLQHFRDFLSDPIAWRAVKNTLIINGYQILIGFPIPIILAILFNEVRSGTLRKVSQSASYLPHFIAPVVVAGMVTTFLASDGIVNSIVSFFGGDPQLWLLKPEWFRTIFVGSSIWQSAGWSAIIFLAAIAAVDQSLYEAAYIDGANRWRRITDITIPSIMPTIVIMGLLRLGAILTLDYQQILLLYSGTTRVTGDVLGTYIFRRGIEGADFSYATTIGLVQAVVGLVFVVASNWVARRVSDTSLW